MQKKKIKKNFNTMLNGELPEPKLEIFNEFFNIVFESLDKMIKDNIMQNLINKNLNGLPDPEKYIRTLIAVLKDKTFISNISSQIRINMRQKKCWQNFSKETKLHKLREYITLNEGAFREIMLNFTINLLTKTNRISYLKNLNRQNIKNLRKNKSNILVKSEQHLSKNIVGELKSVRENNSTVVINVL